MKDEDAQKTEFRGSDDEDSRYQIVCAARDSNSRAKRGPVSVNDITSLRGQLLLLVQSLSVNAFCPGGK